MNKIKLIRTRPKLKFFIKYKIFSSIRIFNIQKFVNEFKIVRQTFVKNKLNFGLRRTGWKNFKESVNRLDLYSLSKLPILLKKRYKILLNKKKRFKLSVFFKNQCLSKIFKSKMPWKTLNFVWLRIDFIIFRLFPIPSLFFVRQLLKHKFIISILFIVIDQNYKIKKGDFFIITKKLFFPKNVLYQKNACLPRLNYISFDINYTTQSFVVNYVKFWYFSNFSSFFGFLFCYESLTNFYNK